jgi:hypothetical protein
MYRPDVLRQNPLGLSVYTGLKEMKGRGKNKSFWEWVPVGGGGHKERGNE